MPLRPHALGYARWPRAAGCGRAFRAHTAAFAQSSTFERFALARERLAYHSALADFAFAMQGLGAGPIALFGSAELKRRYLPEIAAGRCIAAFALSELEAGSDVGALTTRARRENGSYVLEGEKAWISNAGIANCYVVFARTGGSGPKGLSAFAVDAATNGCRAEGANRNDLAASARDAAIRGRSRSERVPDRRGRRRLQNRNGGARRLSQHGRCRGRWFRTTGVGRIGYARENAAALW